VDHLADKLAEALLDSAVVLVEEETYGAEEEATLSPEAPETLDDRTVRPPRGRMALSASAPDLRPGFAQGGPGHRSVLPQTMPLEMVNGQGLPMSWSTRRYHPCKQLSPLASRIKADADGQRPRRLVRRVESQDQRKFVLPMTATNFPDKWESMTRPRKATSRPGAAPAPAPTDEARWLIKVGPDGKTSFPYSLALHKAFLESQSDPLLKEKAIKLAPIRLSKDLL